MITLAVSYYGALEATRRDRLESLISPALRLVSRFASGRWLGYFIGNAVVFLLSAFLAIFIIGFYPIYNWLIPYNLVVVSVPIIGSMMGMLIIGLQIWASQGEIRKILRYAAREAQEKPDQRKF